MTHIIYYPFLGFLMNYYYSFLDGCPKDIGLNGKEVLIRIISIYLIHRKMNQVSIPFSWDWNFFGRWGYLIIRTLA